MDKATSSIKAAIARCAATIKGSHPSWVRGEWANGLLTITIVYTPATGYDTDSGHSGVALFAITPPDDDKITIHCSRSQSAAWMHAAAWHLGAWDISNEIDTWRFRPTWSSPLRLAICKDKTVSNDGTRSYSARFPQNSNIVVLGEE